MHTPAMEGSEPDSPVFGLALITLLCCCERLVALCVRRVGCFAATSYRALTAAPLHLPTDWPAAAARSATHLSQQPCPAILPSHRFVLLMEEKTCVPAGHACAPFSSWCCMCLYSHTRVLVFVSARKYRKMMLQLLDNNRRFAALPHNRWPLYQGQANGNFIKASPNDNFIKQVQWQLYQGQPEDHCGGKGQTFRSGLGGPSRYCAAQAVYQLPAGQRFGQGRPRWPVCPGLLQPERPVP